MKKYFIGNGYFHENKWVNGMNIRTAIPTHEDEIIIDNRCNYVKFKFKNKFRKLLYNLRIAIKCKSFFFWDNITYTELTINTDGHVLISEPLKSSVFTFMTGTVTVDKTLTTDYLKS